MKQKLDKFMDALCGISAMLILALVPAFIFCGCTSTVLHYDENGNLFRKEEVTNFARAMDGTNAKSQMILVDGTYIGTEISASASETYTPGIVARYANGKTAIVNERSDGKFTGADKVLKEFFTGKLSVGADGVKKE